MGVRLCVHRVCAHTSEVTKGIVCPGSELAGGCEPLELGVGSPREHYALLTFEPSLRSPNAGS